jgi:hypothetical protein
LTITGDAERFKVADQAEVTVIHYKAKTVKSRHSVPDGSLKEAAVSEIIEGAKAIPD